MQAESRQDSVVEMIGFGDGAMKRRNGLVRTMRDRRGVERRWMAFDRRAGSNREFRERAPGRVPIRCPTGGSTAPSKSAAASSSTIRSATARPIWARKAWPNIMNTATSGRVRSRTSAIATGSQRWPLSSRLRRQEHRLQRPELLSRRFEGRPALFQLRLGPNARISTARARRPSIRGSEPMTLTLPPGLIVRSSWCHCITPFPLQDRPRHQTRYGVG